MGVREVEDDPYMLEFVPRRMYKIEEMCETAVGKDPYTLKYVPDRYETQ